MSRAAELLREALALLESSTEPVRPWPDGMSEPREDGAVRLKGIEEYRARNALRLAAKGQNLVEWYFVPQAAAKLRAAGDPRALKVDMIAQGGAHGGRYNQAVYYDELYPGGPLNYDSPYTIMDAAAYNYPSLEQTVAVHIARIEDRMNDGGARTDAGGRILPDDGN